MFGQRLRHARRARGLTLADLGARVGRTPSVLSLIENGRREPRLSLVEQIANALDVPVTELEYDKIITAFGAKVFGPLLLAKHFAPLIRPGGSFLFFSGIVGWKPKAGTVVKGIANGALEYVAAHLAAELAPIRVNAIAPGIVDSGTWDGLGDERKAALLGRGAVGSLVGRHGALDDVTDAALWLLGAGYVTGELIHIDGGTRHR